MPDTLLVEIVPRLNGYGFVNPETGLYVGGMIFRTKQLAADYADLNDWIVED